jgi:hypothetical protein
MNTNEIVEQARRIKSKYYADQRALCLDDFSDAGAPTVLVTGKDTLPEYIARCVISGAELRSIESEGDEYWLQREYGISVTLFNQLLTAARD